MIDWSAGRYELVAAELTPAARHVVGLAGLQPGERVLDLACGTGNAALLAAAAGVVATGLDGATRLIDVARVRAAEEGLAPTFEVGDIHDLPFAGETFDVVLSVFGVIFAGDPGRAFAEIMRVLRPGGRALFSAWLPEGPVFEMFGVISRAAVAAGAPDGGPRFAWHDPEVVRELAGAHGGTVEVAEGSLAFEAESPESYYAHQEASHPVGVALGPLLKQAGTTRSTREDALEVLRAGNLDPDGLRVVSRYRVMIFDKEGLNRSGRRQR